MEFNLSSELSYILKGIFFKKEQREKQKGKEEKK
jgi:hypothetical protein